MGNLFFNTIDHLAVQDVSAVSIRVDLVYGHSLCS